MISKVSLLELFPISAKAKDAEDVKGSLKC